jgi:hypothetical protein
MEQAVHSVAVFAFFAIRQAANVKHPFEPKTAISAISADTGKSKILKTW